MWFACNGHQDWSIHQHRRRHFFTLWTRYVSEHDQLKQLQAVFVMWSFCIDCVQARCSYLMTAVRWTWTWGTMNVSLISGSHGIITWQQEKSISQSSTRRGGETTWARPCRVTASKCTKSNWCSKPDYKHNVRWHTVVPRLSQRLCSPREASWVSKQLSDWLMKLEVRFWPNSRSVSYGSVSTEGQSHYE